MIDNAVQYLSDPPWYVIAILGPTLFALAAWVMRLFRKAINAAISWWYRVSDERAARRESHIQQLIESPDMLALEELSMTDARHQSLVALLLVCVLFLGRISIGDSYELLSMILDVAVLLISPWFFIHDAISGWYKKTVVEVYERRSEE